MSDLDAIRARHVPTRDFPEGPEWCDYDSDDVRDCTWPCDTAVVLAALDTAFEAVEEALDTEKQARESAGNYSKKAVETQSALDAALAREQRLRAALEGLRAEVAALTSYKDPHGGPRLQARVLALIDARLKP